ncbi:MAG TPA: hypothetical protein VKR30_02325 [Candidatus Limnocylindrales bacterium]|nr:hypothetical protein [Candidatus Limnocylindrales bacterium]
MFKRLFVTGAAIGAASAWAGFVAARTIWRQWGIEPAEQTIALPGDDLVPAAGAVETRGIDIAAPPSAVWPWLVQMGYGRAGWYSYDGLDIDKPSLDRIVPELQSIEVGNVMPTHPGGGFVVKVVEPEHALVVYNDRATVEAQAATSRGASGGGIEAASPNVRVTGAYLDRAVPGEFEASWAFVIEPTATGTRLVERFRARMEPPKRPSGQPFSIPGFAFSLLGFGVFVMVRRQMLGIRDRAEGRPIRPSILFRTARPMGRAAIRPA